MQAVNNFGVRGLRFGRQNKFSFDQFLAPTINAIRAAEKLFERNRLLENSAHCDRLCWRITEYIVAAQQRLRARPG